MDVRDTRTTLGREADCGKPDSASSRSRRRRLSTTTSDRERTEGVYAGSTPVPFVLFGRHRGRADLLEPCDFERRGATGDGMRSTLVMKGSPVRIRVSASLVSLAGGVDDIPRVRQVATVVKPGE